MIPPAPISPLFPYTTLFRSQNASLDPTGNVNFRWFTNGTCTGTGTAAEIGRASCRERVQISEFDGPLAESDYSFQATYVGYTNFSGSTGDCEKVTVNQASSSTSTVIHSGDPATYVAADNGTSVLTVTAVQTNALVIYQNASLDPTGNVNFRWFTNGTCTGTGTAA